MNSRPRVLHVISVLSFGGAEMWLIALLRYLRDRALSDDGIEAFDILMTGGTRADLDELAEGLGATLHYIPFNRRRSVEFTRAFRALLKQRQYTAIHDHQDYASAWHFLAGAGLLPSVRIAHVHSSVSRLRASTNTATRRVGFKVARSLLRRYATTLLGTSAKALNDYGFISSAFPRQDIRTLHCGFDTLPFAQQHCDANASVCEEFGWPRESPIVMFTGRFDGFDRSNPAVNHKNPRFALDVAREAISRDKSLRFVFVGGGGSAGDALERRVADWGLSDQIRFLGRRLDVPRLMSASVCFLFPSLEEGLGMVAVEAQAAGLRVLASDAVPRECVVIRELVSFRSLSDGASAWADELLTLAALPRFDVNLANQAVRNSSFSIESSYAALHQIYAGWASD